VNQKDDSTLRNSEQRCPKESLQLVTQIYPHVCFVDP
jgi:hypothetical protein